MIETKILQSETTVVMESNSDSGNAKKKASKTSNKDSTRTSFERYPSSGDDSDIMIRDVVSENVKVLVRVRPIIPHDTEIDNAANIQTSNDTNNDNYIRIMDNSSLIVTSSDNKKSFQCSYDSVLGPQSSQRDVYSILEGCTKSVLEGFNSTIFAYGQTGSGKTFSMYGPPDYSNTGNNGNRPPDMVGIIPRAVRDIFVTAQKRNTMKLSVYCSFIQIYNESLFDMLRDPSMETPLTIREDKNEIYVQGVSEYSVKNVNDTLNLLKIAEDNRAIRETHMNQFSSRSHSIFQIFVESKKLADDGGEVSLRAKFNLIDLAGSEKWNTKHLLRDDHINEMNNINLSLHTLGRCISSLAQKAIGKDMHVPYRESKLTRLLQDSLGGNAKTYLLATISPLKSNIDETISTLKFADRAKLVTVQAIINETRPIDHEMVQRLQLEVRNLKILLHQYKGQSLSIGMVNSGDNNYDLESEKYINSNIIEKDDVIRQLRQQLYNEKQQNHTIHLENIEYKNKLQNYETDTHNNSMRKIEKTDTDRRHLKEILQKYDYCHNLNNAIFEKICSLKSVVTKFLSFEVEEDEMRNKTLTIFKHMEGLQDEYLSFLKTNTVQVGTNSNVKALHQSIMNNQTLNKINSPTANIPANDMDGLYNNQIASPLTAYLEPNKRLPILQQQNASFNNSFSINNSKGHKELNRPTHYYKSESYSSNNSSGRSSPLQIITTNFEPRQPSKGSSKKLPEVYSSEHILYTAYTIFKLALPCYISLRQTGRISQERFPSPFLLPSEAPKTFVHCEPDSNSFQSINDNGILPDVQYRVRGQSTGQSNDVVGSTSDWVPTFSSAEDEERLLEEELKKAKKKLKKQQKMQEWMREKEERALAAVQAGEEERKAMQEAELLREQRRKAYANKQKQKLLGYQERVKTEAMRIQELIEIGIDPNSLL